jgi:uncharacterized membrane protein YphA (DoxX/SURF4 family)
MFEQSTASEPRNPLSDWVLRGGVGICFLFIGWGKFPGGTEWVDMFRQIGLGQWFRYFTGVVEALGGLLVLIPRSATAGFALLAVTMAGAALAHIFALGHPFHAVIPVGLFLFFGGCWLSRRNA